MVLLEHFLWVNIYKFLELARIQLGGWKRWEPKEIFKSYGARSDLFKHCQEDWNWILNLVNLERREGIWDRHHHRVLFWAANICPPPESFFKSLVVILPLTTHPNSGSCSSSLDWCFPLLLSYLFFSSVYFASPDAQNKTWLFKKTW